MVYLFQIPIGVDEPVTGMHMVRIDKITCTAA